MNIFDNDPDLAMAYQKSLIFAALEDFSAVETMSSIFGGQYGKHKDIWRKSVADFIFRNMAADLIRVKDGFNIVSPNVSPRDLHAMLLDTNPEEHTLLWAGLQFTATQALIVLMKQFGLFDWSSFHAECSDNFLDALNLIYSR